jgi:hypothetical protein
LSGTPECGQITGRPGADTGTGRPRHASKRFFVDCIAHDADALRLAAAMHGQDRVLFGSDWPFSMGGLPEPHAQLADVDVSGRRRASMAQHLIDRSTASPASFRSGSRSGYWRTIDIWMSMYPIMTSAKCLRNAFLS